MIRLHKSGTHERRPAGRILGYLMLLGLALLTSNNTARGEIDVVQLDTGVYFGGFPRTDSDYAKLRSIGVRHIVDMRPFMHRSSARERRRAQQWGLVYEQIAVGFYPTQDNSTARVMNRIVNRPCGAVYFHCTLGSDRAGMIVALYRVHYQGWDICHAYNDWKKDQFNTKLKDLDRYFWANVGSDVDDEAKCNEEMSDADDGSAEEPSPSDR